MKWNHLIVEFLGTMLISISIYSTHNTIVIGLALALSLLLGSSVSNTVSLNPVIALSYAMLKSLSHSELIGYIVCQILGAWLGFILALYIIK